MVNRPDITWEGCRESSDCSVTDMNMFVVIFLLCEKIKHTVLIKYSDFFCIFLEVLIAKIGGSCPRDIISGFQHDVEFIGTLFDTLNDFECYLRLV